MVIEYTYKINAARVVAENGLTDVVKEVEATLTGTDGAATFALPITVKLADADASSFTAFADLTEAQIVSWVENDPSLEGTKAHIAYVVEKEAAKLAMEAKPLPWVPAPEAPTPTAA
jgi:hypothetical protein